MGTTVQSKSYIPGYSPMRNPNEASSNNWFPYYEDNTVNEHLFNGFIEEPIDEYSEYDKEMLKRTMLEHEAIFRKQVCELHRLYRIQKDMMDELKEQELFKVPAQMDTSLSNLLQFQTPTQKIWQMSHPPASNASSLCAALTGTCDTKAPLTFLKDTSMQPCQIPRKNGVKNGQQLDSRTKRIPRRMLDLQLPADVYIECEDAEKTVEENASVTNFRVVEPVSVVYNVKQEDDVKLTLGTEDPSCSEGNWKLDSHQHDDRFTHSLNYQNEPMKGLSCGWKPGLVSSISLGGTTYHEDIQGQQLHCRSNRSFLPRELFTDKNRDEGACSNFFHADQGEARQEWPTFKNEPGKSGNNVNFFYPSPCSENFPFLSETTELKLKRAQRIPSSDYTTTHTWLGEQPTDGIETAQRTVLPSETNYSVQTSSQGPGTLTVGIGSDHSSSALVPSLRKPKRIISYIPIAVQALPCFNGSEMLNSRRKTNGFIRNSSKLQSNGNLQSGSSVEAESSSYVNGFHHDLQASSSIIQLKNSCHTSAHETTEGHRSQKFPKSSRDVNLNQTPKKSAEGITIKQDVEGRQEEISEKVSWLRIKPDQNDSLMKMGFSQGCSQLKPSSDRLSVETNNALQDFLSSSHSHSTKRILGFPIGDTDNIKSSGKNEVRNAACASGKSVGSCSIALQNCVNLNSVEILTKNLTEVPDVSKNAAYEINLGVLLPSQETLDRLAAESLVAMSFDLNQQSTPASCDTLQWFADVVVSKLASAETTDNDVDYGLDLFESMTLKLEEVKPSEYWLQPHEQDILNYDDNSCTASLLLAKSRRGQARKRRQRKDFQKDILPGLVSLSRHEMAEDLLAFGELMKASGSAWQDSMVRRRKGASCQGRGRGRGRPRNLPVTVTEIRPSPPPTELTCHAEVEIEPRSIMGWGRTTRRGRRPRVKSGNASLFCP